MRKLLRSEILKIFTGKHFYILLGIEVFITVLFAYGFTQDVANTSAAPQQESVSETVLRSFLAMTVFAAMMGVMIITREFSTGTIARTAMYAGQRPRVVLVKFVAALIVGVLMGSIAVATGIPLSIYLLSTKDVSSV